MKPRRQSNVWTKLLGAMAEKPWTVQQLAEAFHLDKRTIHAYLRGMKEDRLIYTCSWEEHSPGPPSRQWAAGQGEDVPPPPRQDAMTQRKKYRARPGAKEREAMLKRNRRRLNKLRSKSLTSILLGV